MVYVLATDILTNELDAIPFPGVHAAELNRYNIHFKVPNTTTHLVISTATVRELAELNRGGFTHSSAAKRALTLLRSLAESDLSSMGEHYSATLDSQSEVPPKEGNITFSLLPVHHHFTARLPFKPSKDDYGGQTILAALTLVFNLAGIRTDGTALDGIVHQFSPNPDVVLLTNDDCLAIRARVRGIATDRFEKQPR